MEETETNVLSALPWPSLIAEGINVLSYVRSAVTLSVSMGGCYNVMLHPVFYSCRDGKCLARS